MKVVARPHIVSIAMFALMLLAFFPNVQYDYVFVKADEPPSEPTTSIIDYHNGTICTITDYGNGTQDFFIETTRNQSAMLLGNNNQSLSLVLEDRQGSTDSSHVTQTNTEVINQDVLMKWEYTVFEGRKDVVLDAWVAWVRIGVVIDIRFGLRLPVNITIEYDLPINFDQSNTTMYATITPIDLPNFNESLCIFKAYLFVECGGGLIGGPYTWTAGPNYDLSQSFETPLGEAIAFPIPPIPAFNIWDFGIPLLGTFLRIDLGIQPGFGSKKITAKMSATGDAQAVEGSNITWTAPNQSSAFIVKFGDYDPLDDWALIKIDDFRYYFTQFYVRFWLMFDFAGWIDWILHDFNFPLVTIDMSWLIQNQNWHIGSSQSIELWFRRPSEVHDMAVIEVTPSTFKAYPGDIINVTVVVENRGSSPEAFNVTLYSNLYITAETQMSQVLENETSRSIIFEWDTTSFSPGNYTIKAIVSTVPDDIDLTNNEKTDGVVTIALCKLSVIVIDGFGNSIPDANVNIVGHQSANTDVNGETCFSLVRGTYQVQVSKGPLSNSAHVQLVTDTVLRISLIAPPAPVVGGETYSIDTATAMLRQTIYFALLASLMVLYIIRKKAVSRTYLT